MTKQEEFDSIYISIVEIANLLKVSRVAVWKRIDSKFLPAPIKAGSTFLWKRKDLIPYLEEWKIVKGSKIKKRNQ